MQQNEIDWKKTSLKAYTVPIILGILIAICFYYIYKEDLKLKERTITKKEKSGILDMNLIKQGNTFVWQGLRGQVPKFFSQKDMKGLGWEEFPVFSIKEKLKFDYGLRILDEYVSPSRMELEFRSGKRPVCTYPYEWKDPAKEFAKGKDYPYLLSVGLDFGGDQDLKIIFLKENLPKFTPYVKDSGMLDIESLLKDKKLKGQLINDAELGKVTEIVIGRNANGDQYVKDEFKKNIKLIVTNNNLQLLNMLKGKRMDYTFEQFITTAHYKHAKLRPQDFEVLSYHKQNVKSVRDPNLITHSIRCNKHPFSYKLMPILNSYILSTRGDQAKVRWLAHRDKIEDRNNFSLKRKGPETIVGRFRSEVGSLEIDWWLKEFYQDYIRNPSKTPLSEKKKNIQAPLILSEMKSSIIDQRKSHLWQYQVDSRLILLGEGDDENAKSNLELSTNTNFYFNLRKNEIAWHIPAHDIDILKKTKAVLIKPDILKTNNKIMSLTISASSLNGPELRKILSYYKNLSELHVLFPNFENSKIILEFLTPKIKKLSIVRGHLKKLDLNKKLKDLNIDYLNLSATKLDNGQIEKIITQHNSRLNVLNLSYQKEISNKSFGEIFQQLKWTKLEELHLQNSMLHGTNIKNITEGIIKSCTRLKILKLDGNFLDPNDFKNLFKNCIHLEKFYSSNSPLFFNNKSYNNYSLPANLHTLVLTNADINSDNLALLNLPEKIKQLGLSENLIDDKGLEYLGSNMPKNIENLSLNNLKNTSNGIKKLFFDNKATPRGWIKNLKKLELEGGKATDASIMAIKNSKIESLRLEDNLLTDKSIQTMSTLDNLISLSIGSNFYTNNGLLQLYKMANFKNLQRLNIDNFLSIDAQELAKNLPSQLKTLSSSGNLLSTNNTKMILEKIPKGLISLNLVSNQLDSSGIEAFILNMPSHLSTLALSGTFSNQSSYCKLVNAIPNSVTSFSLHKGLFDINNQNCSHLSYPRELDHFSLNLNSWSKEFRSSVLLNLPSSINQLGLIGASIDEDAAKILSNYNNISVQTLGIFTTASKIPISDTFISLYNATHEQVNSILTSGVKSVYLKMDDPPKENFFTNFPSPKVQGGQLLSLGLLGQGVTDNAIIKYAKSNFSHVFRLNLDGTSLTHIGLTTILKAISPQALFLSIQSSSMTLVGVDSVIAAIPKTVRILNITGSKIGEKGYQKFRDWKKRQEEYLGYNVDLVE